MSDPKKIKGNLKVEGDLSLPSESTSKALTIDNSGNVKASDVTTTELSHLSGVTSGVQSQLNDITSDISDIQQDITNLESDNSDVAQDLSDHISSGVAHAASAIVVIPAGNLAADDVQEALEELQSDVDSRIPSSEKGQADGVATLDATGKVPSTQLPSYVDDVLEYADFASFPIEGEQGKIYVTLDSNKTYRWSGSVYIEISPSEVNTVFGRTGIVVAESGDYTADQITNVPAGNLAATDVQAALNELQDDIDDRALASDLTDHINDTTEAHASTAISFSSGGDLVATTVKAAIDELEGLIDDHIAETEGAHAASAISVVPTGNLSSDDVQSALEELQGNIDSLAVSSSGDIFETSFNMVNNQAAAANVTGFLFNAATVRSFSALVSVEIDATADLYEQFTLEGINKGSSFNMAVSSVGDDSGVVFSITSGGQIQYTSEDYVGFDSAKIKFRAIVTSVS